MRRYLARIGETEIDLEVAGSNGAYAVRVAGQERRVEARGSGASIVIASEGRILEALVVPEVARVGAQRTGERRYEVTLGGRVYSVLLQDPLRRDSRSATPEPGGPVQVRSIMPGKVASLLVREGQEVRAGQGVVVVEAMKMENEIQAPKDGRVASLRVRPGETVEAGVLLFTVE